MAQVDEDKGERLIWGIVALAFVVVIGGFFGGVVYMKSRWFPLHEPEEFGAAVGAIGGFFSALAFVGVIATVLLQSRELKLQRQELRSQSISMNQDVFERGLFQLMTLNREALASLRGGTMNNPLYAHAALVYRVDDFRHTRNVEGGNKVALSNLVEAHLARYLEPYLSSCQATLDYVMSSRLLDDERFRYSQMLIGQLSVAERAVIRACALVRGGSFARHVIAIGLGAGSFDQYPSFAVFEKVFNAETHT